MDEGIAVGISSHSALGDPRHFALRRITALYYVILHIWMSWSATARPRPTGFPCCRGAHRPVAYWAGIGITRSRRAALTCATLFAFNGFLDYYSVETRMYTMMTLLGLLATVGFVRGFVFRERRYVILFRGRRGADAVHAQLGALLRCRRVLVADPPLLHQRRGEPHESRTRRDRRLRRSRNPVLAVDSELHLPGAAYRRTMGHQAALWRVRADRIGHPRRRLDRRRDAAGGRHRLLAAVLEAQTYDTRGEGRADAGHARSLHACCGMGQLTGDHARVGRPLLRARRRTDPPAARQSASPVPGWSAR